MNRRSQILFALFGAFLIVSVAPGMAANSPSVAATDDLVVGGQHTDFGTGDEPAPAKTTNMTISGSGDSATVEYSGGKTTTYSVVNQDGDGVTDGEYGFVGDGGGDNPIHGEIQIQPGTDGTLNSLTLNISDVVGSDYGVLVDVYIIQETPDTTYGEGTKIKDNWDPSWTTGNQTIQLDSAVDVTADTNYTIEFVSDSSDGDGAYDVLEIASDDSLNNWMSSAGTLRDAGGDLYADISPGSGQTALYRSANYSVENSEQVAVNLTQVSSTSANITVEGWTGSSWTTLNKTTDITTAANHTLSWSAFSGTTVRVEVHAEKTGSDSTLIIADESILFSNQAPSASNVEPADGSKVTNQTVSFGVDVSDPTFSTAQGDNVTASLIIDGSKVDSKTISSNQTVTIDHSFTTGGNHTYYWRLEDSYDGVTTTQNRTLTTPEELRIYNESAHSELVDNVSVTVRFLFQGDREDLVVTRNVTNGVVNFTDLPNDVPFVVSADADGYRPRRIYVDSLYRTQNVYLLPDSAEYVSPAFDLKDYTGRFPESSTVLIIKRPINESWQRVQADYFGATDTVKAQLKYNTRHRLYLHNTETGERRFLGKYTPLESGPKTLKVTSDGTILLDRKVAIVQISPSVKTLAGVDGTNVTVSLDNQSNELESWEVTVNYLKNGTSQQLAYYNKSGPSGGTVSPTLDLGNRSGGEVQVVVNYTVSGGLLNQETSTFRVAVDYDNEHSLLAILFNGLPKLIPSQNYGMFTTLLSVLVTAFVTTASAARMQLPTEGVGLVAVGTISFFSIIGFVSYTIVFVGGISWLSFAALRRGL